jgi:hypothetical protein
MQKQKQLLTLEDFFVFKLNIESVFEGNPTPECAENPLVDYEVFRDQEDVKLWALKLSVRSIVPAEKSIPGYVIDAQAFGTFSFKDEATEDEKQYLIRVNGATILYGLLRGMLATVSGSFPRGKHVLPSVFMQEIVDKIEKQRQAKKKKDSSE